MSKNIATTFALSAAALFLAGCEKNAPDTAAPAADAGAKVKCLGINDCKGHADCGAADGSHSCAGQNDCKGKGWVLATQADCDAKGGKVL